MNDMSLPNFTYCIRDDRGARVKIGHSRRPDERLRQLQTGSGNPLRLVGQFQAGKYGERSFHDAYYGRRLSVNGRATEWLDDADEKVSTNFIEVAGRWKPGTVFWHGPRP